MAQNNDGKKPLSQQKRATLGQYVDMKAVRQRIRELRKEQYGNLPRHKIPGLEESLGFTADNYKKIELGMRGLSIVSLVAIASFYDVSIDYLLYGGSKDRSRRPLGGKTKKK